MAMRACTLSGVAEVSDCLAFAELLSDLVTGPFVHMAISEIPDDAVFVHRRLDDNPAQYFRILYEVDRAFCDRWQPGAARSCPIGS